MTKKAGRASELPHIVITRNRSRINRGMPSEEFRVGLLQRWMLLKYRHDPMLADNPRAGDFIVTAASTARIDEVCRKMKANNVRCVYVPWLKAIASIRLT